MQFQILHGDCLSILPTLPDNSVDSIVTDPPYELGFMGKSWDASGIAYNVDVWREALRVLKPGGHLLAFSGSRTYHRMTCAIEDAGFEIRDQIMWVYGSGFPKSLDVSKAIDKSRAGHAFDDIRDYLRGAIKAAGLTQVQVKAHLGYPPDSGIVSHWVANSQPMVPGWADWSAMKAILPLDDRFDSLIESAEREKIGEKRSGIADGGPARDTIGGGKSVVVDITAPATDAARQWEGWGTALKPAHEPICVARKPLIGTVAANVLAHGTGALNIDACRVGDFVNSTPSGVDRRNAALAEAGYRPGTYQMGETTPNGAPGRWPANLIHDGSDEVVALFPDSNGSGPARMLKRGKREGEGWGMADEAGELRDAGSGSAARFFYCAKASRADRNEGLEDPGQQFKRGTTLRQVENLNDSGERKGNHHPTVKPTDLMAYLCRLVTPHGGLVLDMFMGSGSTGKAAMREGFRFVGIDMAAEYIEIARARIEHELFGDLL